MAHNVGRDPFARGEYLRVCVTQGKCSWCGNSKPRLYAYVWSPDDRPKQPKDVIVDHRFCNFGCFKAYNG